MTVRERLHQLVDELPDEAVARILDDLERRRDDPVRWALDHATVDDEPETDSEREAVAEALAERRRGEGRPAAEVWRELGT